MHSKTLRCTTILTIVLAFSTFALAGPPLICHSLNIGPAKTLPWVDLNYQKGDGGYDLKNLATDTLAILDGSQSALVHMETIRRATVFARRDSLVKKELLVRLHTRATSAGAADNAFALFDLGYFAEAEKQWSSIGESNPASSIEGYALIQKALALRADPEMEFGAALVALTKSEEERNPHVQRALAGAKTNTLLAQNLNSSFNKQTIASLLNDGERN